MTQDYRDAYAHQKLFDRAVYGDDAPRDEEMDSIMSSDGLGEAASATPEAGHRA